MTQACYTVAQLAERLNVARKTVYRMIWRGQISAVRIGRAVRIEPDEAERYLKTVRALSSRKPQKSKPRKRRRSQ